MALKYGTNNVTSLVYNGNTVNTLKKDGTIVWERPYQLTINVSGASYIASYNISRASTKEPTASTGTLQSGSTIYHEDTLSVDRTATPTRYEYSSFSPSSLSGLTPTTVKENQITFQQTSGYSCAIMYGTDPDNLTNETIPVPSGSSWTATYLQPGTTYYFKLKTTSYRTVTPYNHSVDVAWTPGSHITTPAYSVKGDLTCTITGSETAGTPYQDSTTSFAYSDIVSVTTAMWTGSFSKTSVAVISRTTSSKTTKLLINPSDLGLTTFTANMKVTGVFKYKSRVETAEQAIIPFNSVEVPWYSSGSASITSATYIDKGEETAYQLSVQSAGAYYQIQFPVLTIGFNLTTTHTFDFEVELTKLEK